MEDEQEFSAVSIVAVPLVHTDIHKTTDVLMSLIASICICPASHKPPGVTRVAGADYHDICQILPKLVVFGIAADKLGGTGRHPSACCCSRHMWDMDPVADFRPSVLRRRRRHQGGRHVWRVCCFWDGLGCLGTGQGPYVNPPRINSSSIKKYCQATGGN